MQHTVSEFVVKDEHGTWKFVSTSTGHNELGVIFSASLDGIDTLEFALFDYSVEAVGMRVKTIGTDFFLVQLKKFQVYKDRRRKGYGAAALEHIIELYAKSGCTGIEVQAPNAQGARCYKRAGMYDAAVKGSLWLRFDQTTTKEKDPHPATNDMQGSTSDVGDVDGPSSEDQDDDDRRSAAEDSTDGEDLDDDKGDYVFEEDEGDNSDDEDDEDYEGDEDMARIPGSDGAPIAKDVVISKTPSGVRIVAVKATRGASSEGFVVEQAGDKRCISDASTFEAFQDNTDWEVSRCSKDSKFGKMVEKSSNTEYTLHVNRIRKGMLHLKQDSLLQPMLSASCSCKNIKCTRRLSLDQIREIRTTIYTRCDDETAVANHIQSKIEGSGNALKIHGGKVCRKYYAVVHSVSEKKIKNAMKAAKEGARPSKKRKDKGQAPRAKVKYDTAYCFWHTFFAYMSQRPNEEVRLFPVNLSYKAIFADFFEPWFTRQKCGPEARPSFTTFKSARFHDDFKDVKSRRTHTHARCQECYELAALRLSRFKTGKDEEEFNRRRRLHDEEVKAWRGLEAVTHSRVANSPGEYMLFEFDDTCKIGFPHLGRRTTKNLDHFRFNWIPWLGVDHGANRKDYIYTPKVSYGKGTNRLITQLHAMVRRAKSNYAHPQHRARTLICIADSASDQKNNELLAYCTELVQVGWFDSIELLYGPVGHTHNGVDATHKIHNQHVGELPAGDIGHWTKNFEKVFDTAPGACILDVILDWKEYYEPHLAKIAGFTKSKTQKSSVRGFRIAKQKDGTVDLTWKEDPALKPDPRHWRGRDGFEGHQGYTMLRSLPTGQPKILREWMGLTGGKKKKSPEEIQASARKKAKKLLSPNWTNILKSQDMEACQQWNHDAYQRGCIEVPHQDWLEATTPTAQLGRLAIVGSSADASKRGFLRIINEDSFWDTSKDATRENMWKLPEGPNGEHIAAVSNPFHVSNDAASAIARTKLPRVRPLGESAANCEMGSHPQVCDIMRKGKKRAPQRGGGTWMCTGDNNDDDDDDDDDEDGSDHENEGNNSPSASQLTASNVEGGTRASPWIYVVDIENAKEGGFVVALAQEEKEPRRSYIIVGKIIDKGIHKDDVGGSRIEYKPYTCTADPWTKKCITSKWHLHSARHTDIVEDWAVISYPAKLNQGKLPAKDQTCITKRSIFTDDGSDGGASDYSDTEEEEEPEEVEKHPVVETRCAAGGAPDMTKAKVGEFAVISAEDSVSNGPAARPYIIVGKISKINIMMDGTIEYQPYKCTADPWTTKCLSSPWHNHGRKTETVEHTAVIEYLTKLSSAKKLPAKVQSNVKARNLLPNQND